MGLGTKKGGFGATKVKANFAEIEQQAAMADHLKVVAAEEAKLVASRTAEEEEKQMASMRLAYQDLGIQQKKEEEKMKQTDPKKAKQIERLGMGFGARG
jgi:ADP-ribosylation factor GTPase-activating protein 2/3